MLVAMAIAFKVWRRGEEADKYWDDEPRKLRILRLGKYGTSRDKSSESSGGWTSQQAKPFPESCMQQGRRFPESQTGANTGRAGKQATTEQQQARAQAPIAGLSQ
ncbi:hypothetical protein AVEN_74493-1 [Araneus ventricosus]|uniref:Uncharacterized protein n=1 Tax=Araneus ventricosus TaxID=182803 RepID=A0A4Y2X8H1_ARAVE|nr:hypothetical protein AVEN_74493-1 [Araneus ventricosus]